MAPALGLGVLLGLLGLLGDPGGATRVLHSMHYLAVGVSEPSPGIPKYMELGFVDGIPFTRYDSERGRVEPLTQWIKDGADPEYWDRESQRAERNQQMAALDLETARERYNQSRGLHTVLRVSGCDLLSDGSIRGTSRDGYDGRDFISFDLESGRFVAADSAAEVTRRFWEHEGIEAERKTNYLKHICPEWLRKYVGYGQKELERKEPPDVRVSGKEEHGTLILSCHAYGFYPSTIAVNWMKGDEIWDQETEWGGVVPNSDGTFHTWARIEALPEEREQYRCRVEHPGMPEPGIFAWEPPGGNLGVAVAVSVIAAVLTLILVGFLVWKRQSGRRDRDGYNVAAGEFQWRIRLWIPSVRIPGWILGLIPVCDPCWNLMDLLFLQEKIWEPRAQPQESPPEPSMELDPTPFLRGTDISGPGGFSPTSSFQLLLCKEKSLKSASSSRILASNDPFAKQSPAGILLILCFNQWDQRGIVPVHQCCSGSMGTPYKISKNL